jgi:hypothetical protein
VHARNAQAVAGDADVMGESLVAGRHERLDGAAGTVGGLPLVLLHEVVQLDEVDMVDAEPLERALEAGAGAVPGTLTGLCRQEELAPVLRQPRRQPELRVAVVGGRVEVIDAELEQRRQQLVRPFLAHVAERGRPEDHPAALVSGPAEGCGVDVPQVIGEDAAGAVTCAQHCTASTANRTPD